MSEGSKLLDKLHLLDYDKEMIVKRNFVPLNKFSFLASYDANFQFYYLGNLVNWLLQQLGIEFPTPGEFDDPNLSSTSMANALKEVGMEDIHPLKLKSGTGSTVIEVLDVLTDMVLKERGFVFTKPIFKADVKTEEAIVDEDAEITTTAVEIDEKEWDLDEQDLDSVMEKTSFEVSKSTNNLKEIQNPKVDVEKWSLEVERVTPLLKTVNTDSRNWRIHLESMNFHYNKINQIQDSILGSTTKLCSDIDKTLEKIRSREKYLSSQFENYSQKYLEISQSMSEFKQDFLSANSKVSTLQETLSGVSEELESIKGRMDEIGNGMTDSKPLLNIKSAVLQLKSEIKTMDLRIGVMEHSLMQNKLTTKPHFLYA